MIEHPWFSGMKSTLSFWKLLKNFTLILLPFCIKLKGILAHLLTIMPYLGKLKHINLGSNVKSRANSWQFIYEYASCFYSLNVFSSFFEEIIYIFKAIKFSNLPTYRIEMFFLRVQREKSSICCWSSYITFQFRYLLCLLKVNPIL